MMEQYINAGHRYTYTSVHTTTAGWSVGGQLGVKAGIWDPKFTFSWSDAVTTGHTVGANKDCGSDLGQNGMLGNWSVSLSQRAATDCKFAESLQDVRNGDHPSLRS